MLSTLTTKQHFFVDITAGLLLAASSAWWVAHPAARRSCTGTRY
jgi:hypothetical protein